MESICSRPRRTATAMLDVVPLRNTAHASPRYRFFDSNRSAGRPGLRRANVIRTLATLNLLLITTPIDALVVAFAFVRRARPPAPGPRTTFPHTVLVTGCKMTKAL